MSEKLADAKKVLRNLETTHNVPIMLPAIVYSILEHCEEQERQAEDRHTVFCAMRKRHDGLIRQLQDIVREQVALMDVLVEHVGRYLVNAIVTKDSDDYSDGAEELRAEARKRLEADAAPIRDGIGGPVVGKATVATEGKAHLEIDDPKLIERLKVARKRMEDGNGD